MSAFPETRAAAGYAARYGPQRAGPRAPTCCCGSSAVCQAAWSWPSATRPAGPGWRPAATTRTWPRSPQV
jgi:hypothetical protein